MPPSRVAQIALWGAYALIAVLHLGALAGGAEVLQRVTQPLFAPILLAILLLSAAPRHRTTALMGAGLFFALTGDTLPQFLPSALRPAAALFFLLALLFYCLALAPLWARTRDTLRIALAIPYGGVVIGLFVACADGAGNLVPLVAAYAVTLATMAFLSAGVNGLTWTGGTLFLLSSSLLAMDWFLPGAAIAYSTLLVMATYTLGHALLVAGVMQTLPRRRWAPQPVGAELVIVEG